jgi:hypothetical protein
VAVADRIAISILLDLMVADTVQLLYCVFAREVSRLWMVILKFPTDLVASMLYYVIEKPATTVYL